MNKLIILTLLFIINIGIANALVVINSNDWRVIYLGIEYSKLNGDDYLIVSNPNQIQGLNKKIIIIQDDKNVKIPGLYETIKMNNKNTYLISGKNIVSLELKMFKGYNNFCIVNSNFGYDAITLSPDYKKCIIVFYERGDLNDLLKLVKDSKVTSYVDDGFLIDNLVRVSITPKVIYHTFGELNTQMINESNSSLYEMMDISDIDPTLLFDKPIILPIDNVTSVIKSLNDSKIKILEVVGVKNIQTALQIKDALKRHVSVLIKYGRVSISNNGASTLPLNLYNFGKLTENLTVVNAYYNVPTKSMVIVFKNIGTAPLFFYSMKINNIKDDHLHKINVGETVSIPFNMNFSSEISGITAYGYTKLDKFINGSSWKLNVTKTYFKQPRISIENIYFNQSDYCFYIKIKNEIKDPVYVDAEIYNFIKNGKNTTYSFNGTLKILRYGMLVIPIDAKMSDIIQNKRINLAVYYGRNATILTSYISSKFKYKIISSSYKVINWELIVLIAIITSIIILIALRKNKRKKK